MAFNLILKARILEVLLTIIWLVIMPSPENSFMPFPWNSFIRIIRLKSRLPEMDLLLGQMVLIVQMGKNKPAIQDDILRKSKYAQSKCTSNKIPDREEFSASLALYTCQHLTCQCHVLFLSILLSPINNKISKFSAFFKSSLYKASALRDLGCRNMLHELRNPRYFISCCFALQAHNYHIQGPSKKLRRISRLRGRQTLTKRACKIAG